MMTHEQIAAMRADAEAGTPGPWLREAQGVYAEGGMALVAHLKSHEWGRDWPTTELDGARIARVPDMEATIIAQAAEIARLTEMLAVQWEGIPWRDGPPPKEWQDGRPVLVWTKGLRHVFWEGAWFIAHENGYSVDYSMITHHAAVTAPHEKGQPG
jgi:hypothetical protein